MAAHSLTSTQSRVSANTADSVNRAIHQRTQERLAYYKQNRREIDVRLGELDREWDIERVLETNAAAVTLAGLVLGQRSHVFRFVPLLVAGFLLQHALQGWCPPLPLFRRLGVRTAREIAEERHTLEGMRGASAR